MTEHPVYDLQRLLREHEMAMSRVAAFHGSDVQKTLSNLKDYVHGVMDALPGDVKASAGMTDQERADQERRQGEKSLKPQSIDAAVAEMHKPGSGLDKDIPVGAQRLSDHQPQTQQTKDKADKAPPPDVSKLSFVEVEALQPK